MYMPYKPQKPVMKLQLHDIALSVENELRKSKCTKQCSV